MNESRASRAGRGRGPAPGGFLLVLAMVLGATAPVAGDGPDPLAHRRDGLARTLADAPNPAAATSLETADGALAAQAGTTGPRRDALRDLADAALTLGERQVALAEERGRLARLRAEVEDATGEATALENRLEDRLTQAAADAGEVP